MLDGNEAVSDRALRRRLTGGMQVLTLAFLPQEPQLN